MPGSSRTKLERPPSRRAAIATLVSFVRTQGRLTKRSLARAAGSVQERALLATSAKLELTHLSTHLMGVQSVQVIHSRKSLALEV